MKLKTLLPAALATLLAGWFIGRCSAPAASSADTVGAAPSLAAEAAEPTIWTCSMHPQIQQPNPGSCPICGMDLIPRTAGGNASGPRTLVMSEHARILAEVETTPIVRGYPEVPIRLVGQLEYDETREKTLTARFPARIETLFVNFTGVPVERGEHLAVVYSPELLSAQRELLSAHRRDPDGPLTAAARDKLRLWDLLPEQIEAILERGEASDQFELRAPVGGVVVGKPVKEGDYVQTGQPLFRIVDLSRLWLTLDAYESDLAWLRFGQAVEFTVESYPGETFRGKIVFIEPELNRRTRTIPIRVNVPNAEGRLKPGMFARGIVHARVAENGQVYAPDLAGKWISPMHPEIIKDAPGLCDVCGMDLVPAESLGYVAGSTADAPLLVPASAVLRTGRRAVVYVAVPDTTEPTFEGREITLGPRAGDVFLVASGLEAGESVVTHGAFKIDSALQLEAKPSMMNPPAEPASTTTPELTIPTALAVRTLPMYLDLQDALASDAFAEAIAALDGMMAVTGHTGPLPDLLHTMLAADDLDALRRPHFETLSKAFLAAIADDPAAFPPDLLQMHCPMVYPDRGADWIQAEPTLRNPYFGATMLRCGEVRATLTTGASEASSHTGHDH